MEGAHQNVGMGHRFLRHIERTKALIYVVDINGFQLSERHPFRSALETVQLLHKVCMPHLRLLEHTKSYVYRQYLMTMFEKMLP